MTMHVIKNLFLVLDLTSSTSDAYKLYRLQTEQLWWVINLEQMQNMLHQNVSFVVTFHHLLF